ncbi:RING-H2 finger protein ATL63 [Arachis duranensis]|uniref:RING-type E3 ubiquitin transferase n=1 Tax=Arachis duranensis TaxID=130453 RepID=A0A6P4BUF1_ARADU|nr:RING-H2 finger protein ATL63 [Arachis duranensis]
MNTLSQIFQNMFSDNSNIMLAAIISLLLVILFVLLLHLYAKWFLAQAQAQANARRRRRRRRRAATVTVSDVLGPARFHHFHSFNIEDSPIFPSSSSSHHNTSKGLDSSIIARIPLFIYTTTNSEVLKGSEEVENSDELECVICLSSFEDGEMGRCLPKCGHGFHVDCIDMWLNSHSNCPICRAPIILSSGIVVENDNSQLGSVIDDGGDHNDHDHDHVHVHNVDDGSGASAFVEIVVDDFGQSSEIRENNENGERVSSSSDSSVSETETSTSLVIVGCSLKRMLSKVFPSSNNANVNELQT